MVEFSWIAKYPQLCYIEIGYDIYYVKLTSALSYQSYIFGEHIDILE